MSVRAFMGQDPGFLSCSPNLVDRVLLCSQLRENYVGRHDLTTIAAVRHCYLMCLDPVLLAQRTERMMQDILDYEQEEKGKVAVSQCCSDVDGCCGGEKTCDCEYSYTSHIHSHPSDLPIHLPCSPTPQ